MQLRTTRFGPIEIQIDDVVLFPQGLIGFEDHRHWVILADADDDTIAWLQSVSRAEIALPIVSPKRFVPEYSVRVASSELEPLKLASVDQAHVLNIVSRNGEWLTLNLKAPLIVNLDRRLGRQVVTIDEQPTQHHLAQVAAQLLKSA